MRIGIVAAASLPFAALWLAALFAHDAGWREIAAQIAAAPSIDLTTALQVSLAHHGPMVWGLAAIAAAVALVRRSERALILIAWFGVLFGLALLPQRAVGGEYLPPALVVLMGFLPAALLVGELAKRADLSLRAVFAKQSPPQQLGIASSRKPLLAMTGLCLTATLTIISLLGAWDMLSIVNPATILFTRADEQAMRWIGRHTPGDARFLVNSFAWYGSAYMPSDGGGWIPYLTGRAVDFVASSTALGYDDPDAVARWIAARKITHIYFGRRAGVLFESDFASQAERYELLYDQQGIAIFRVR